MGLFSLTHEIAMDLGTANTIIIHNGNIVVDEPSVVALDRRTDKLLAVGEKARQMHGKTHENIRTIRPLRDGVIADFYACEQMMRGMIKMAMPKNSWFSSSLRMVISIPSGSTEVEIRAVRDSAEHAGGRDVYLIYEPMAAAIGIGLDRIWSLVKSDVIGINFDTGTSTKLAKWLTWNVTLSDRYLNHPAPGRKTNDFLYTTGLGVVFGVVVALCIAGEVVLADELEDSLGAVAGTGCKV